jgi:hypothetical protein
MWDAVNIQWIFIENFPVSFHWFGTKWRAFLLAEWLTRRDVTRHFAQLSLRSAPW